MKKKLKLKKKTVVIIIALSAIISLVLLLPLFNPLRRTEEGVREYLLSITPVGTSMEDVIKVIENKKWEPMYKSEHGYVITKHGARGSSLDPDDQIIGVKRIRVELGSYYRFPFGANVTAFYGFDEDSKLIDIGIWKTTWH